VLDAGQRDLQRGQVRPELALEPGAQIGKVK
jgi:hypothetical protein